MDVDSILAALYAREITPAEAKARLFPPKRGKGRPKKPEERFKCYSIVTDPKTGKETRKKTYAVNDYKTIPAQVKKIGQRYEELRQAGRSECEAISAIQEETASKKREPISERYIHKCHSDYMNWVHVQRYFKDFITN